MYPSSLYSFYLIIAAVFTVTAALLALVSKEDVYAALSLGLLGIGVSALVALLGYGILSVFHILVYVGATVTFVVFSVLLIGRGVGWEKRLFTTGVVTAVLIAISYFISMYAISSGQMGVVSLSLSEVGGELFSKHILSLVFLAFALASVMIEGVLIASRKGEK